MFMFVIKLKLDPTKYEEEILEKRFALTNKCHNVIAKEAKKRYRILMSNADYAACLSEYKQVVNDITKNLASITKTENNILDKKNPGTVPANEILEKLLEESEALSKRKESLAESLKKYRENAGLTKSGLETYIKVFQGRNSTNISSHIAQKEAEYVYKGVESVLFRNGKELHFRKLQYMSTISSKSSTNGIRFYDKTKDICCTPKSFKPQHDIGVEYLGLDIKVKWSRDEQANEWLNKALRKARGHISYCSIKRMEFNSGMKYYLIIVVNESSPKLRIMGKGKMGGDPGVSTFAAVGDDFAMLEELAPDCKKYNKLIQKQQRNIDTSKRLSNPDNYKADGTVKKGRHKWKKSKKCLRRERQVRILYRKKSEYIKCEHNHRANIILMHCDTFINEEMNFSALARKTKGKAERSEKTTFVRNKDGTTKEIRKFKKKKRFGKSILDRAPALQCRAIENKMIQYGGKYIETKTRHMRASQYNHVTDKYVKPLLSERFKEIGGFLVQRDLYSAFLQKNARADGKKPNRSKCKKDFDKFLKLQSDLFAEIRKEHPVRPACFGF